MSQPFSQLPLASHLLHNLETLGYEEMTPVQAESLPLLLEGKDLIAQAETGSGKTAAFGLSLLHRLEVEKFRVQGMVLCPTRELAQQVAREFRRLARATHNIKILELCGGLPIGPQIHSLEHGAHIIVGTPGRVLKHLDKETLSLAHLHTLVLDEADRMLDMGFEESIRTILTHCPDKERQTLLFSATYPESIESLSKDLQRDPAMVVIESTHDQESIEQWLYEIPESGHKDNVLEGLLVHYRPESCLVFCNTKAETAGLAEELVNRGFVALAIHGDMEQPARTEMLVRFANRSATVLVATDVAARGLDIADLELVVNYDISYDPHVHIHRVGRTGRAGKHGRAISLMHREEAPLVKAIEEAQDAPIPRAELIDLMSISDEPLRPEMVTLCLDGGKKKKVRPGDILGALTKDAGLPGKHVGSIDIFDHISYIAVHHSIAKQALQHFKRGKVKGRHFRARRAH